LEYTIRKVYENKEGLELNGTHQHDDDDDVNILGGNTNIIDKNTEPLLDASKEDGLEVNANYRTEPLYTASPYNKPE
jgi:hypothetical protein